MLDERTLAFPSYDGNGMFRSLGNVLVNPKVGLLFIDFEHPHRMRINGIASLHDDPEDLAGFEGAQLVVHVRAERISSELPPLHPQAGSGRDIRVRPAPRPPAAGSGLEADGHLPGLSPGSRSGALSRIGRVHPGMSRPADRISPMSVRS